MDCMLKLGWVGVLAGGEGGDRELIVTSDMVKEHDAL